MRQRTTAAVCCALALAVAVMSAGCSGEEVRQRSGGPVNRIADREGAAEHTRPRPGMNRARPEQGFAGMLSASGANSAAGPQLQDGPESVVRKPQSLTLAELRRKYPSTFIIGGADSRREVALSFDDAPDNLFTPLVLDALKKEGVKATFFCIGNRIEAYPDVMRRIVAEGHVVGNHSYSHANLPKLTDAQFREEIRKTDRLIKQYAGYTPSFVRPPYGNISEQQIKWLASQHRKVVNWNVDSLDWKSLTREQVSLNVLSNVRPGSIVLQHSGGGTGEDLTGTVEALPDIIGKLREDGIRIVTIPQMLGIPK